MAQNPDSKVLASLAEKLGFIADDKILKNGETYLRILKSKSNIKGLSEVTKAVLCLDLAAKAQGTLFDNEMVIKLSGIRKTAYLNNLHTLQKILDLDRPMTVSELCVQFSCTAVKELAEQILKKYEEEDVIGRDFTHPQYLAAAIYTACKLRHLKVQKTQFIAISRLKNTEWKELEQQFLKFAERNGFTVEKKSKKNDLINYIEEHSNGCGSENKALQKDEEHEDNDNVEDYETWKTRILTEAYALINNIDAHSHENC